MNFCGQCGTKLVDGGCGSCTAKSANGLSMETLEKSLTQLESLSKGVRPNEAKAETIEDVTAAEHNKKAIEQRHKWEKNKGEGESEEEPKTKRGVESAAKGFPPPGGGDDMYGEEEERDPREEDERDEEPEFKSAKSKKKTKKSLADDILENEEVSKAVDVTPFLKEVVETLSDSHDSLASTVSKSIAFSRYQKEFNIGLAKALNEMSNVVKGLVAKVDELGKSPAAQRKSDTSAVVIEKSFANGDAEGKNQLTKGQIASKLLSLMEAGDASITEADILRAESTGAVRPNLMEKLGLSGK